MPQLSNSRSKCSVLSGGQWIGSFIHHKMSSITRIKTRDQLTLQNPTAWTVGLDWTPVTDAGISMQLSFMQVQLFPLSKHPGNFLLHLIANLQFFVRSTVISYWTASRSVEFISLHQLDSVNVIEQFRQLRVVRNTRTYCDGCERD